MSVKHIDQRLLELFVSKKYHWKSLNPDQQQSMAVELLKHRVFEQRLLDYIGQEITKQSSGGNDEAKTVRQDT